MALPRAVPFVGRTNDRAQIERWLEEGARLVTITGPGGIGKTALAAELAAAAPDAILVELAELGEGAADAVAVALGVEPARLAAALDARGPVRLFLDDADGVMTELPALVEAWLGDAPELAVIVTSRRRLALAEEVVHELGPLGDDGVTLLERAAQRRAAGFALRDDDRAAARAIAARLDGHPLALQMAAARLPLAGAHAVLASLDATPLVRDARGPARHASLDAAVAGSFAALSPALRDALAALALFHGGFTLASMERIVTLPPGTHADALAELRDRSLVRMRDPAKARFDLYASVRGYVERHHPRATAERHDAYFVAEAERAAAASPHDRAARAWLAEERENVLAVVRRALDPSAPAPSAPTAEGALRALLALGPLMVGTGALGSIAALVSPLVERTRDSGADPRLTARAMLLRGALRRERGAVRDALKDLLAAETIARSLREAVLEADAGLELGRTLLVAKEDAAARTQLDKVVAAFGALGARAREAQALAARAAVEATPASRAGFLARAAALVREEEALRAPIAVALGRALAEAGDAARAESTLREVLGNDEVRADALLALGVLLARTRPDEAERTLRAAEDAFAFAGRPVDAAIARGHRGFLAEARGDAADAYALFADARDAALAAGRTAEAALFDRTAGPVHGHALVIGKDGAWFVPPGGARAGLERRKNLALILAQLAASHPAACPSPALFRVAWPGEKAMASAAAHRVRVAIATLRKLGLGAHLVTHPDGYGLAPDLVIERV